MQNVSWNTVRDIIESIDSVKKSVYIALEEKDTFKYRELMGNLVALEACLVEEVKKALKDTD